MFKRVAVAIAATLAAATLGQIGMVHARVLILGGTPAPADAWPSIVALVPDASATNAGAFCGGSLIAPDWVLTAAHCVAGEAQDQAAEVDIVAGVTNLVDDPGQRLNVSQIVRHPSFDNVTVANDVALLRLATPASLGPGVAVVDLVSPLRPELWASGSPAQVAGWGLVNATDLPAELRQASVAMVSDQTCATLLAGSNPLTFQPASMVCAGVPGTPVGFCQGDSGGPLTVDDGATRVLVGAVSWGVLCSSTLRPGADVYTRLDAARSFVFGPSGLNVNVPGAPTGVSAVAGAMSANVSWTAPASNGGRAVQTYGVRVIQNGIPGQLVAVPGTATQAAIAGLAPGSTYTFAVLAANAVGLSPPSSETVGVVPTELLPVATAAPVVTGTPRRGEVLTATAGTWSFAGATTIAWERCGATGEGCRDIAGQTSGNVQLGPDDVGSRLRVRVVATNPAGATTARSALTTIVVPPAPAPTLAPAISGVAREGSALTATTGSWSEPADVQIVWQSCDGSGTACGDIAGAVGPMFTPTRDLVGRRLRVHTSATNAGGIGQGASDATSVVRGVFAVTTLTPPRVTRSPTGLLTVTVLVTADPGARLAVQVIDHRGRVRRVARLPHRSIGAIAVRRGVPTVTSIAPATGRVNVVLGLGVAKRGPMRVGTVVVTATGTAGERATLARTFRARL